MKKHTCLSSFDFIFHFKPELLYNQKRFYQSSFGGLFSVLYIIVMITVTAVLLENLIRSIRVNVCSHFEFYSEENQMKIQRNLTLNVSLLDRTTLKVIKADPRVLAVYQIERLVPYTNENFEYNNIGNGSIENSTSKMDSIEDKYYSSRKILFRNSSHFNYIDLVIEKCSNASQVKCRSPSMINKILFNSYLSIKLHLDFYDTSTFTTKSDTKQLITKLDNLKLMSSEAALIYLTPLTYQEDNNSFLPTYTGISGDFMSIDSQNFQYYDNDNEKNFHTLFLLSSNFYVTVISQGNIIQTFLPFLICSLKIIDELMRHVYFFIQRYYYLHDFEAFFTKAMNIFESSNDELKRHADMGSIVIPNPPKLFIKDNSLDKSSSNANSRKINCMIVTPNSFSIAPHETSFSILKDPRIIEFNGGNRNLQGDKESENAHQIPTIVRIKPEGSFTFQNSGSVPKNDGDSITKDIEKKKLESNLNKGAFFYRQMNVKSSEKKGVKTKKKFFCFCCCLHGNNSMKRSKERKKIREWIKKSISIEEISTRMIYVEENLMKANLNESFKLSKENSHSLWKQDSLIYV